MASSAPRPHPLIELTRARLLEFLREREALFWVFVFPVLLALALGIAFRSRSPERIPVAVTGAATGAMVERLSGSPDLAPAPLHEAEADQALRSGKVDLVVLTRLDGPPVVRYDPTRSEARAARLAVTQALLPEQPGIDEERISEPGSRYIDFLIPGLIGLNLMGSGMWGVGFAMVMARSRKLLKRFAATPMRRSHYLLSFGLSRLVFLFLEVAALVTFGELVFGVRVRGSFVAVALIAVLGSFTFAAVGLLVAARPKTIEGVSGLMNLVMLPMWLLSGTFFSYERFPAVVQPAIRALPLTAINDALRAVINQGQPLASMWMEVAVMALWCLGSFAIAVRIFRWQ